MINKILQIRHSGFAKNVAVIAGGTAVAQTLAVLVAPILTRLYTPEDFGLLAIYVSLLGIMGVVASLRYEMAIPLPSDDETAANILVLSLLIVLGMAVLAAGLLGAAGDRMMDWARAPLLKPYLWLLPAGFLGSGIYQALNFWAVRKKAFPRIARTRLNRSFGLIAAQLGLGCLKFGPLGLLLGQLTGEAAGSITLATLAWQQDRENFKKVTFSSIFGAASRYRRFPIYMSGSAILNSLGQYLPALLMSAFFGPQVAGWYALATRVITTPATLIGSAIGQVYFGEGAQMVYTDLNKYKQFFFKTTSRLFLIGLAPAVVLGFLGPILFVLVFGENWREAGQYAQILAPSFLVQFCIGQTSNFVILEKLRMVLVYNALFLCLVALSLYIGKYLSFSPNQALVLFSVSMVIAYIIRFWLYVYAIECELRLKGYNLVIR